MGEESKSGCDAAWATCLDANVFGRRSNPVHKPALVALILERVHRGIAGYEQVRLTEELRDEFDRILDKANCLGSPGRVSQPLFHLSAQATVSTGPTSDSLWTLKRGGRDAAVDREHAKSWAALTSAVDTLHWDSTLRAALRDPHAVERIYDELLLRLAEDASEECMKLLEVLAGRNAIGGEVSTPPATQRAEAAVEPDIAALSDAMSRMPPAGGTVRLAPGYLYLPGLERFRTLLDGSSSVRLLVTPPAPNRSREQIVEQYNHSTTIVERLDSVKYRSPARRRRIVHDALSSVREALGYSDQTDEMQSFLRSLRDQIDAGRVTVRLYPGARFDARAYIFTDAADAAGAVVVGGDNLSTLDFRSGLAFPLVLDDETTVSLTCTRFDDAWGKSIAIDRELLEELDTCWALNTPTPYDIYVRTLIELGADAGDSDTEENVLSGSQIFEQLADFQRVAVEQAVRTLDHRRGCFIADVVGLGKSFMASAVMKYFVERDRVRPVIICPAGLVSMWEMYSEVYHLNAKVVSTGLLKYRGESGDTYLLDDTSLHERDFVVIDESHNFRNTGTQRYEIMRRFLSSGARCLLLTATPQSRGPRDIFNQIKLFHQDDVTDLPISPPDLAEFFAAVENGNARIQDLLQHLLIRRTRTHVLKWYGIDKDTGKRIDPAHYDDYTTGKRRAMVRVGDREQAFPRRELETVSYSIEEAYNGLYEDIRDQISRVPGSNTSTTLGRGLTYARYNLWPYLRPDRRDDAKYAELRTASLGLAGLIRTLLFKRFESSVEAFRRTVSRMAEMHAGVSAALDRGILPAGEAAQSALATYAASTDASESEQRLIEELQSLPEHYPIDDFDIERYRSHVEHDGQVLRRLFESVAPITASEDRKLVQLVELLQASDLRDRKCLIFTEFSDTAEYVHKRLASFVRSDELSLVHTGSADRRRVVGRFSPRSNPQFSFRRDETEVRVLIATDVLSEGLNLQDCNLVINYDLHWNPVRLIQRFGRVDRIGTEHDTIRAYNFLPETGLERELGLEQTLAARISEIHAAIGEDSAVLHSHETVNPDAMYAIYDANTAALAAIEDAEDPFEQAEAEALLRRLREEEPEEYDRIASLPDGVRAAHRTDCPGTFVLCRAGDYRRAYILEEDGKITEPQIGTVLSRISAEPDAASAPMPRAYNRSVETVRAAFERDVQERRSRRSRAPKPTRSQRDTVERLRAMLSAARSESDRRQLETLKAYYESPLTDRAKRELRRLAGSNLSDSDLLNELARLHSDLRNRTSRTAGGQESRIDIPRVICSEALLVD